MGRTSVARHLVPRIAERLNLHTAPVFVDLRGNQDSRRGLAVGFSRTHPPLTACSLSPCSRRQSAHAMHQILQQIDSETACRFGGMADEVLVRRECHRLLRVSQPERQIMLVLDNAPSAHSVEHLLPLEDSGMLPDAVLWGFVRACTHNLGVGSRPDVSSHCTGDFVAVCRV